MLYMYYKNGSKQMTKSRYIHKGQFQYILVSFKKLSHWKMSLYKCWLFTCTFKCVLNSSKLNSTPNFKLLWPSFQFPFMDYSHCFQMGWTISVSQIRMAVKIFKEIDLKMLQKTMSIIIGCFFFSYIKKFLNWKMKMTSYQKWQVRLSTLQMCSK